MKILFASSTSFVFPVLEFLAQEHELLAILTNAPARFGRGKKMEASPLLKSLKAYIDKFGNSKEETAESQVAKKLSHIKIIEAEKLDEKIEEEIQKLHCDLLVCYSYGKIFTEKFLSSFRHGGINLHPSLLPRWRGASPVPAAILNGDRITGISIQTLVKKMDAGKILASSEYHLNDSKNAGEVLDILTKKSIPLLNEVLKDFPKALNSAREQNEAEATYCTKLEAQKINWESSATDIMRTVLALSPKPKAFSFVAGERITLSTVKALNKKDLENIDKKLLEKKEENGKILQSNKNYGILVQSGDGIVAIQSLQRQGKKELNWKDFLNGYKNFLELKFES